MPPVLLTSVTGKSAAAVKRPLVDTLGDENHTPSKSDTWAPGMDTGLDTPSGSKRARTSVG
jgi:hypothetical protein